jgi:hypothetical protein
MTDYNTVNYIRDVAETVYTIDQLRYEVEENQMGIGISDEDGPINMLITVLLNSREDYEAWVSICHLHPGTQEPSSYPAIACWYTDCKRGNNWKTQDYTLLPLKDIPCVDNTRLGKAKQSGAERIA